MNGVDVTADGPDHDAGGGGDRLNLLKDRNHATSQMIKETANPIPAKSNSANPNTSPIDSDNQVLALPSRVAGHCLFDGTKAGVAIEKKTGYILKLVSADARGEREKQFYETIFNCDQAVVKSEKEDDTHYEYRQLSDEIKQLLRPLVANFFGVITLNDRNFLRFEDRSLGGDNVMDIKIGERTWDRYATAEKIANDERKKAFPDQKFRILGFRAKNNLTNGQLVMKDKKDLKHLVDCRDVFKLYFDGCAKRRDQFVQHIERVRDFFRDHNRQLEFISSSLLLSWGDDRVNVTMIDFAHVFIIDGIDVNYLNGIDALLVEIKSIELN